MKMIGKDPYNYSNYNVGVNKKKNKKIKQINKSMDDVNGIEEILNGEEDANPNKSFLMKKNRVMSPTNNNQKLKLNLNEKNKSKTKYGSSMSINSFPKTNKSQSTKKIIHKNKTSTKNNINKKDQEKNNDKNKVTKKMKKNITKNNNT